MKLGSINWCKVTETLANLKCPHCFSAKVNLSKGDDENAKCEDCGCKFEFNPDIDLTSIPDQ